MSQPEARVGRSTIAPDEFSDSRRANRLEHFLAWWVAHRAGAHASTEGVGADIRWECSQRTIWIATQSSEFLGMVELHRGRFVANDTQHGTYRSYSSLAAAQQAFESPFHNMPSVV